jgi:hypothetical protein
VAGTVDVDQHGRVVRRDRLSLASFAVDAVSVLSQSGMLRAWIGAMLGWRRASGSTK